MLSLLKTLKILAVMRRTSAMGLLVAGILIPALEGRAAHIMSTPRSAMTTKRQWRHKARRLRGQVSRKPRTTLRTGTRSACMTARIASGLPFPPMGRKEADVSHISRKTASVFGGSRSPATSTGSSDSRLPTHHLNAHATIGEVGAGARFGSPGSDGAFYIWDGSTNNVSRNNIFFKATTGSSP